MVHLVIFQKWIAILVFDLDAVLNKYVGDISYLRCIKTCWNHQGKRNYDKVCSDIINIHILYHWQPSAF